MEIQRALHQINAHMAQSNTQYCVSELIILFCQKLKTHLYTHVQKSSIMPTYKCRLCKQCYNTKKL